MAAIQVLIYAGAIAILIVFGIMLITKGEGKMGETNLFGKYKISWDSGLNYGFLGFLFSITNPMANNH